MKYVYYDQKRQKSFIKIFLFAKKRHNEIDLNILKNISKKQKKIFFVDSVQNFENYIFIFL